MSFICHTSAWRLCTTCTYHSRCISNRVAGCVRDGKIHHGGQSQQSCHCPNGAQWKCKQRSPMRPNKWSVVGAAQRNSHVCRCFGTGCLATVTAISHGRNLRPNPIRSGHYWEMRRRESDGGREDGEREIELLERGKRWKKKWRRGKKEARDDEEEEEKERKLERSDSGRERDDWKVRGMDDKLMSASMSISAMHT